MGKPGLENREKSILKNSSWQFWTIRVNRKERKIFTTKFLQLWKPSDCDHSGTNSACRCGQRWLWMLRQITSNSIFWRFRAIKILMRGRKQWFDLSIDMHKFKVFDKYQDRRYQASSYGELRVSLSRWNIINSVIWDIWLSVFHCKHQNRQYTQRKCFS